MSNDIFDELQKIHTALDVQGRMIATILEELDTRKHQNKAAQQVAKQQLQNVCQMFGNNPLFANHPEIKNLLSGIQEMKNGG